MDNQESQPTNREMFFSQYSSCLAAVVAGAKAASDAGENIAYCASLLPGRFHAHNNLEAGWSGAAIVRLEQAVYLLSKALGEWRELSGLETEDPIPSDVSDTD